ncbi:UI-like [Polyodon spathula]|uniref:UI-like n=1 Tax=Polyodon spathula TaxID=7913 RepID=UPI001B7E5EDA|nr:UI-like [Polyodon spathula]
MELSWMYINSQISIKQDFSDRVLGSSIRACVENVIFFYSYFNLEHLTASSMKKTPLVLLTVSILLVSHIPPSVCRPMGTNTFNRHGYKIQDDNVLVKAGDNAMSYLVGEKLLRYLEKNPRFQIILSQLPLGNVQFVKALSTKGLAQPAHNIQVVDGEEPWREEVNSLKDLSELSKRAEDPPISIDLTFHLLRNMMEMARIENQREQAELNRKYLNEVGK